MIIALMTLMAYIGYCIGSLIMQILIWTVTLIGTALFYVLKYGKRLIEWVVKFIALLVSLAYTRACILYQSRYKAQNEGAFMGSIVEIYPLQ